MHVYLERKFLTFSVIYLTFSAYLFTKKFSFNVSLILALHNFIVFITTQAIKANLLFLPSAVNLN